MGNKIEKLQNIENEIEALKSSLQEQAKAVRYKQLEIWRELENETTDGYLEEAMLEQTLTLLKRRTAQTKNIMNWENIPAENE